LVGRVFNGIDVLDSSRKSGGSRGIGAHENIAGEAPAVKICSMAIDHLVIFSSCEAGDFIK
jgi:hypothetical protein